MGAPDMPLVWFSPPEIAVEIDLGDDPGARTAVLDRPAVPADERAGLIAAQELLVERLRGGGVGYAAHLVGLAEDRPTVALLSVVVTPVELGDDDLLDSVATAVAAQGNRRVVEHLDLPCGHAQLFVEDQVVSPFDDEPRWRRTVRQAQVIVPFPDRAHLATIALSTEFRRDWAGWMRLLGTVAATLSFVAPGTRPAPSRIASALGL